MTSSGFIFYRGNRLLQKVATFWLCIEDGADTAAAQPQITILTVSSTSRMLLKFPTLGPLLFFPKGFIKAALG
jgi:hypothetical protein